MQSTADECALEEEDRARAECYGLISRLLYAPADADLLRELAGPSQAQPVPDQESQTTDPAPDAYPEALRRLQEAARRADAATLRQEYDDIFIGAGKALVTLYTSAYALPHAPDRHLLTLRERLMAWGLKRRDAVFELEDHVSAVCDVMRWLIERRRPLDDQLAFFNDFVYSGVGPFCAAIETRAHTAFYRCVAAFVRTFIAIEKEAFDLHGVE